MKKIFALITALFSFSLPVFAEPAAAPAEQPAMGLLSFWPILLIIGLYVWMLMGERKRKKNAKNMLDCMEAGDEVITIGGITGKILNVKDETITLEVGADRTKLEFQKWAVKTVTKPE